MLLWRTTCYTRAMQKRVTLTKKVGETPLSCMENWRERAGLAHDIPLTYAGRLDPLASGKLLVLVGDACKTKERYQALDKAYDFSILFGVETDSGDPLGLARAHPKSTVADTTVAAALQQCQGVMTLPYPVFSAKPVKGKPLHTWAAEGRLDEITIPSNQTTIYKLSCSECTLLSRDEVYARVIDKIESIPPVTELRKALGNDFRRPDIRAQWKTWYEQTPATQKYTLASCHVACSSGTYVRSLAAHIGDLCDSKALAFAIHRTTIGTYRTFGPIRYWWPSY